MRGLPAKVKADYLKRFKTVCIRLAKYGCTNRPFYHIVAIQTWRAREDEPLEQLGSFDPMPNMHGEKLVAINADRLKFWLGYPRIMISDTVLILLGLGGYLPLHPLTRIHADRARALAQRTPPEDEEELKAFRREERGLHPGLRFSIDPEYIPYIRSAVNRRFGDSVKSVGGADGDDVGAEPSDPS